MISLAVFRQVVPAGVGSQVWVAAEQVTSPAELPTAPPARCPECGAPFEVGADGCCPFCHREVEVPAPVLVSGGGRSTDVGGESSPGVRAVEQAAKGALRLLFGS